MKTFPKATLNGNQGKFIDLIALKVSNIFQKTLDGQLPYSRDFLRLRQRVSDKHYRPSIQELNQVLHLEYQRHQQGSRRKFEWYRVTPCTWIEVQLTVAL